jgi:hypothetical protein
VFWGVLEINIEIFSKYAIIYGVKIPGRGVSLCER